MGKKLGSLIGCGERRLFRNGRGKEARLCFMGQLLMENRHGLIVDDRPPERDLGDSGAERGGGDGRRGSGPAPDHRRRRQAVRRCGLRRPEHCGPALRHRQPHEAAPRLQLDPAGEEADRGGVRPDRGGGAATPRRSPRQGPDRLAVHARRGRLGPDLPAQAARSRGMSAVTARRRRPHTAGRSTRGRASARTRGRRWPAARRPVRFSAAC